MSKRGSKSLKKYTSVSWEHGKFINKKYKSRITKSFKRKIEKEHILIIKRNYLNLITEKFCLVLNKENAVKYRKIERIFLELDMNQIIMIYNDVDSLFNDGNEKKLTFFEFFDM